VAPANGATCIEADLIENTIDDGVDEISESLRFPVEMWARRKDHRTRLKEGAGVSRVDEIPRSFAWDEDELPLFLQEHIGCAQDGGVGGAHGDPSKSSHGTRDDDHRVDQSGSADKGDIHAFVAVLVYPFRNDEAAELFLDDLASVRTEHEIDFVFMRIKAQKEPLEVDGPAGSGAGDNKSHRDGWAGE
jgi:hypothetical protein